jgi:hypothetical protein
MAEITKPLIDPDKIIKEVFGTDNIGAKTELNPMQIETVNKLRTLSRLYGSVILDLHLDDFMILQKSKDRKSMSEFVESLRSKKDELIQKGKSFHMLG